MKTKKKLEALAHRCACPNNNLFVFAVISVIVFLLAELTLRIYDLYRTAPMIDILSHIFGGIALGSVLIWIISLTSLHHKKWTAIVLTLIGALVWEALEELQELVFFNPPELVDIFFYDGVADVIVTTLAGAAVMLFLYWNRDGFLKRVKI